VTITVTPRFGLTQWSAESDAPSRSQFETSFQNIDALGAIDIQDVIANRPVSGIQGRYFWATDQQNLYRDNGAAWVLLTPNATVQVPHSWEITGQDQIALGASGYIGPMFVPVPTGQTAVLHSLVTMTRSGAVTFQMQQNGNPITGPGVSGGTQITATTTPSARLIPSPSVNFADLDQLAPLVTSVSGAPDGLTVTVFINYTFPP
jgi:hypothetical protein